ncbi:MAG TPA: phage holin family protein [Reyranella sp.]|nr:phage holin family protein [Reyranella sp.]
MIAQFLRLAALPAMARELRDSAADAATRAGLVAAAGVVGAIGLLCLSYAGLTLLQREMDPAAAWAIVGGVYAAAGGGLYFAATRRRRG